MKKKYIKSTVAIAVAVIAAVASLTTGGCVFAAGQQNNHNKTTNITHNAPANQNTSTHSTKNINNHTDNSVKNTTNKTDRSTTINANGNNHQISVGDGNKVNYTNN